MFIRFTRAAGCVLLSAMLIMNVGCGSIAHEIDREVFGDSAVNDFIDRKGEDLDKIKELVCDPGEDACLSSSRYDKLGKLKNLETVTFVGIGNEEDAERFFGELTKLDDLKTVIIKDSRIGSVSKLVDIGGLEELHIILRPFTLDSYKIGDLDKLAGLKNLRVLDLQNVFKNGFPDLRSLDGLEDLTISAYEIKELPYDLIDWSGLRSLSICATGISSIDDRITGDLTDLKKLDISYSNIEDVSFVLELPKLEEFSYRKHSANDVDMKILEDHSNFVESWLVD